MKITLLLTSLFFMAVTAAVPKPVVSQMRPDGAADRMLTIGKTFLGTPYVAHVLDEDKDEKLIIHPDQLDCLTYVEYVLATYLCTKSDDIKKVDDPCFASNVQKIRYRDGRINGYQSRLHYTSDWINNGIRNGFLEDITSIHSPETILLDLHYMSAHPESYKQLVDAPDNITRIIKCEKALTGQTVHWVSKQNLPEEGFPWIQEGDIIAITTNISGLDIVHIGLAIYENGKLHLLHASSTIGKVVISESPLSRMFDKNKSWTGIRVIRAKKAIS